MDGIVTLYSTSCPKCRLLKKILNNTGIGYVEVTDIKEMLSLGFEEVPMLKVGDRFLNYKDAVNAIVNGDIK